MPRQREDLESLPGVGRKTANVILNTAFGEPTIAVDTHIFRVANRTGIAPGKNVVEVENKLMKFVPEEFRKDAHHWLILHGRYVCKARKPACPTCLIRDLCEYRHKTRADVQSRREEARRFFFEAWGKYRSQVPLEGLERTAIEIILLHPEYHALLDERGAIADRDFSPESGAAQSFPAPVAASCDRRAAFHRSAAGHPCTAPAIAGKPERARCAACAAGMPRRNRMAGAATGMPPDEAAYLECIRRNLG